MLKLLPMKAIEPFQVLTVVASWGGSIDVEE
jgi:hypothetical protein